MKHINYLIFLFRFYKQYVGIHIFLYGISFIIISMLEIIGLALFAPILSLESRNEVNKNSVNYYFDQVISWFNLPNTLTTILFFLVLIFFIKGIITFMVQYYGYYLLANFIQKIRLEIVTVFQRMSFKEYTSNNIGNLTNIVTTETQRTINGFKKFITYIADIIYIFTLFTASLFINWKIILLSSFFGVGYILLTRKVVQKQKALSNKVSLHNGLLQNRLIELLINFKLFLATSRFENHHPRIESEVKKLVLLVKKSGYISAFLSAIQEPIIIFLLAIILLVQTNLFNIEVSETIVIILILFRLYKKFTDVINVWQKFNVQVGGLNSVIELRKRLSKSFKKNGELIIKPPYHIIFRNVSFSHTNNSFLKNINFEIKENETIGLAGKSGSGKTTLVDLLIGLHAPSKGNFFINNQNAEKIDFNNFRKNVGFVPQDSILFDDTIANNIDLSFGNSKNDLSKIKNVSKLANCYNFIMESENNFNTKIGDRGLRLSGGQKQRIAIARELYKNPKILILDESTSSLDSESEKSISKSIKNLKGKVTVIIIAHRLSTLKHCDKILFLDSGTIVEEGSFDELVKKSKSKFKKMWDAQINK